MVTDEDVRKMIARVQSGQAEDDEIVEFLLSLIPPKAIDIKRVAKYRKSKET